MGSLSSLGDSNRGSAYWNECFEMDEAGKLPESGLER